jgi:hypothetical protein
VTRDELYELDAMLEKVIRVAYERGLPRTFADRVWSVRAMLLSPQMLSETSVLGNDGYESRGGKT